MSGPTLEAPDDDPFLWLEGGENPPATAWGDGATQAPQAPAWVDAQSEATLARFGDAGFAADRDALLAIFDRPDRIAMPTRRGAFLYHFWRDAANPRGV